MQGPDKGVSPELVLQFLAWNGESAARCGVLSPAGAAPANVRSLFHSSTVQRACPGCLLEQVAPLTIHAASVLAVCRVSEMHAEGRDPHPQAILLHLFGWSGQKVLVPR